MTSVIRRTWIFVSFLVLLIGVTACGGTGESVAGPTVTDMEGVRASPAATATVDEPVAPTSAPAIPTPTPPLYAPTVVGWPPEGDIIHRIGEDGHSHEPAHHYAANPSVKEQIYHSDVVVRASLVSATNDILRFQVLEYLKGVGPNEITISASTANRDAQYDDREAILFLKTSSGGSGNGSASFEFGEGIYDTYRNGFPSGYAINQKTRAWMPATSVVGATGSAGDTEGIKFDPGAPAPGRMHDPPLTVEQIKAIITWMYAQNAMEYRECIKDVVSSENHYRDWAAYYGTLDRPEVEKEIASGSAAGAIIWHTDERFGPHYGTFSVEGEHSALFSNSYSDDDNNPRNVYSSTFATTRPLPAGTYKVTSVTVNGHFIACNHIPPEGYGGRLYWTVTATAPENTLHEAFFDPASTSLGVGFQGSQGVLSPASFTHGDGSSSIVGLGWEDGEVTLVLSPYVSLAGKTLEFIELDGTVGLSLGFDDGVSDGESGRVVWGVDEQPWESGDRLMIRIR